MEGQGEGKMKNSGKAAAAATSVENDAIESAQEKSFRIPLVSPKLIIYLLVSIIK
jgi:hypothetical protein